MSKQFLSIILLLMFIPSAFADGLSLASFSYEWVPNAEIDRFGVEERELETSAHTLTTKLAIPILLSGKNSMLLNFITLRSLRQTYDNVDSAGITFRPDYLYTVKYGLVFRQRLSDRWIVSVLVQPALLTDFENVGFDHLVVRAGFIFERKVSDRFRYGIGVGYSDDYGDEKILPVLRLNWNPNQRWKIRFDVPQKLDWWYVINDHIRVGIHAKATGAHYRIGEAVELPDGRSTEGGRIKYSIVNAGPAVGLKMYKGINLVITGGKSLYRKFQAFDGDDEEFADHTFENSIFFKTVIRYDVGSD